MARELLRWVSVRSEKKWWLRKLQVTYSFLCFLLVLTWPWWTRCFGDKKLLLSSARLCLAALALSRITSKGRDPGVELEVEGSVLRDNWVKVGSSGNKGSPSWECLQTCFSQAEELNQCILGFSLPLQYRQAKATFRWSWQMCVQAAAFCKNICGQSVNWHL